MNIPFEALFNVSNDFHKLFDPLNIEIKMGQVSCESEIKVGDYVLVHDEDNPRSEYIEGITEIDKEPVYLLSDGTWVAGEYSVSKYEVQGEERQELMKKLNRII